MNTAQHAARTQQALGIRADDIHRWIDGLFDAEGFAHFLRAGRTPDYDPYDHRKFRHCTEALEEAYQEFEGVYSRDQIRGVFELHVRDDYDGYLPRRADFENGTFVERYHESGTPLEQEPILSSAELGDYFKNQHERNAAAQRISPAIGFYLRIALPTLIAFVLFILTTFFAIIPAYRNTMQNQKRQLIRELTAVAASEINYFVTRQQAGSLSLGEAKRLAAEDIRAMRYGSEGKDYFWITDMHPTMIMHPYRPELQGKDLTTYRDSGLQGSKQLFVELAELVRQQGEGYLQYRWQMPGTKSVPVPKLSYVTGIPEWGWIVGTGIYLNDVQLEVARLTTGLQTFFVLVSLGLTLLLTSVIWQSRRIERQRLRAERGLREAKDRYRALVEASNEGYLLQIDGATVYANRALQRLLGQDEASLLGLPLTSLLDKTITASQDDMAHLRQLSEGAAGSRQFTAKLHTRTGDTHDVTIATSRIFLSEKVGQLISFRLAARNSASPALEMFEATRGTGEQELPVAIREAVATIEQGNGEGDIVLALSRLPGLIHHSSLQGVAPALLRESIGATFDAAVERTLALALDSQGTPPVPFAFLCLGSNARHEMTMYSDQDNALVFADVPAAQLDATRRQFLKLADQVCSKLNQAGYPYCPGGLLASNPKWCLSVTEWRKRIFASAQSGKAAATLDLHVLLDMRCGYGDVALMQHVRQAMHAAIAGAPAILPQLAGQALQYKPPTGRLRERGRTRTGTFNIKDALKAMETVARLYAARAGIEEVTTLRRLDALEASDVLSADITRDIRYAFNALWHLRLNNQLVAGLSLRTDLDEMELDRLGGIERRNLRNVLAAIASFQRKLSYDFCGGEGR
jgi:CBS domain-containing protein